MPPDTTSFFAVFRLVVWVLLQGIFPLSAQSIPPPAPEKIVLWNEGDANQQNWMFHFQNTDILQGQPGFNSPYQSLNSWDATQALRHTISADIFLGAHLWPGGEIYFNPEYQGFGTENTLGLAAFPSIDAYGLQRRSGFVWVSHLFYRQIFGLGGEQEQLPTGPLQLAEKEDISRLTLTMGRYAVNDFSIQMLTPIMVALNS